jgi:diguanylate cyclase (GGDEF)-like protein
VTRPAPWQLWVIVGTVLSVISVFVPPSRWTFMIVTAGIGLLSATVAVVVSRRLKRPLQAAWICLALALALNSSGSIVETFSIEVLHSAAWPSPAAVFYFLLYPFLAISVGIIIRQRTRRHEPSHILDSLIITAGVGLLCWIVLISPALGDPLSSVLARVADAASPVGDLVILAALVRLLLHGGWRIPALRLLTASIGLFLAVDLAWTIANLINESFDPGRLASAVLTILPLLAYVLAAAVPLHPSAQDLAVVDGATDYALGPALLGSLSLACLIAPGTLLFQTLRGQVTDGLAIAVCAAALILLVIARMADLLRRVQTQSVQLAELALEDPLTGLANRRALTVRLSSEMELARRQPHSLAIAMVDLDFFKRFNDTYGHSAGDRLLVAASEEWRANLRASDFLARMGGEEFLIILPGVDPAQAQRSMVRLQAAMPLAQSFSAGVALWDGQELSEELIERADLAMYAAKTAGRARWAMAATTRPAWPLDGSGVTIEAPVPAAASVTSGLAGMHPTMSGLGG